MMAARVCGLPANRVVCRVKRMGGGRTDLENLGAVGQRDLAGLAKNRHLPEIIWVAGKAAETGCDLQLPAQEG